MVNFGLNSASILGIFLAVAGASLYFLRNVRPELARDHDIFFAAVGLLCGFILVFQGWRLDPILQFGQFLLIGSTVFFAVESIRLRQVATEQARRNTPTVDRERPVSRTRVYREEEYDSDRDRNIPGYNAYEGATPNYDSPRLRGYDDPQPRSSRSRSVRDEEPRTRSYSAREERYSSTEPPRRRAKNTPSRQDSYQENERDNYDRWSEQDSWDEPNYANPTRPASNKRDRYSEDREVQNEPKPNTRRPTRNPVDRDRSYRNDRNENLGRNYDDGLGTSYEEDLDDNYQEDKEDVIVTDYVDYQPSSDHDYDDEDDYEDRERRNEERGKRD
jgi:hypothetical protein